MWELCALCEIYVAMWEHYTLCEIYVTHPYLIRRHDNVSRPIINCRNCFFTRIAHPHQVLDGFEPILRIIVFMHVIYTTMQALCVMCYT